MEPKQRKFSIGYLAIALIALLVFQFPLFAPRAANVSYSEFKALVASTTRSGSFSRQPTNESARP